MLCYRHDGQTTPSIIAPISLQGCEGELPGRVRAVWRPRLSICSRILYIIKNKSFHFSICSRHRLTVQPRTHLHP